MDDFFNEDDVATNCCGHPYTRGQWENVKRACLNLLGEPMDDEYPMCPDCWVDEMAGVEAILPATRE